MSWLWRGDASSPASFEKALSKLSGQITSANLSLDTTRSRARRIKALWTLWTIIFYILYALILVLVLGLQNASAGHYGGLVGGPVVIYAVRTILTTFFDWRISRQQSYLRALQKQREAKIADLKKATKYDSTQELLQKYGGAPPKETTPTKKGGKRKSSPPRQPQQRTGLPPPPTANIPRPNSPASRPQIQPPKDIPSPHSPLQISQSPGQFSPDAPGFAPNAFPMPPPVAPAAYQQQSAPHWYDRILDVMLGEDETAAKNRLALICSNCRLVNGQAPPGVRTLEEVGRWRCSSCGGWNGTDERKAAREIVESARRDPGLPASGDDNGWEQVLKDGDSAGEEADHIPVESVEGSTGRENRGDGGGAEAPTPTKRVTRSMVPSENDD